MNRVGALIVVIVADNGDIIGPGIKTQIENTNDILVATGLVIIEIVPHRSFTGTALDEVASDTGDLVARAAVVQHHVSGRIQHKSMPDVVFFGSPQITVIGGTGGVAHEG